MKIKNGFISIVILLAIVLGFIVLGGGAYLLQQKNPAEVVSNATTTNETSSVSTTAPTITLPSVSPTTTLPSSVIGSTATGTLIMEYAGTELPNIDGVSHEAALRLCAIALRDTCIWRGVDIADKPLIGNAPPSISIISPVSGALLSYGDTYNILFIDPRQSGRYRVYLVHRNLLGTIDETHEAYIVAGVGDKTKAFSWKLQELYVDETGGESVRQLAQGTYELSVANIDTGAAGLMPGTMHVGPASYSAADVLSRTAGLKPYAANTPLLDSYWDGRGLFMNGNGGADTLVIKGKRSDVVVYRGVDMPAQNQYETLVFFRKTDNAVIIAVNVESIRFDDQTVRAADLISQLPQQ